VLCAAAAFAAGAGAAPAAASHIAVPAYFDPGSGWTALEHAGSAVALVVANPDSGPGSVRIPAYAHTIRAATAAGETVVGYVDTAYAHRPLAAVEADVSTYYRWYGVQGIFFDDAPTNCAQEPYYAALRAFVNTHGPGQSTIINPGTFTSRCYMRAANILLTFEGSYHQYTTGYEAPAWTADYPARRFWQIVYAAPTSADLRQSFALAAARDAGLIYVTPQRLPNPYARLPNLSYWDAELARAA
jgi:hypothetical protein